MVKGLDQSRYEIKVISFKERHAFASKYYSNRNHRTEYSQQKPKVAGSELIYCIDRRVLGTLVTEMPGE